MVTVSENRGVTAIARREEERLFVGASTRSTLVQTSSGMADDFVRHGRRDFFFDPSRFSVFPQPT